MKPNIGQGDTGKTALFGGGAKVAKDSAQVEAYGSLDELNSWVGYIRSVVSGTEPGLGPLLQQVQEDLFVAGAVIAAARDVAGYPAIGQEAIEFVTAAIATYEAGVPELRNFILPGGAPKAALFDLARTACRRAERRIVTFLRRRASMRGRGGRTQDSGLRTRDPLVEKRQAVLAYVNRLSDLLFALERWVNQRQGVPEFEWIGMREAARRDPPP
ncbi:MAG: cob(I)yrinic acid a,c-diamide adenosyltransferase [Chloroflexi bacterium]|nr:cob(I)yrinic acid a,c-diamide adenosyltransferase [Chloroflexota bacterium]